MDITGYVTKLGTGKCIFRQVTAKLSGNRMGVLRSDFPGEPIFPDGAEGKAQTSVLSWSAPLETRYGIEKQPL